MAPEAAAVEEAAAAPVELASAELLAAAAAAEELGLAAAEPVEEAAVKELPAEELGAAVVEVPAVDETAVRAKTHARKHAKRKRPDNISTKLEKRFQTCAGDAVSGVARGAGT